MKTGQYVRIKTSDQHKRIRFTALLAALLVAAAWGVKADETLTNAPSAQPAPAAKHDEKGAPLPLHQIEGNGGIFATLSAYIVNPPRDGEAVGRPSLGFAYVNLGHEQNLEALTVTESPLKRLELGYGWNHLGLGDLPGALNTALGGFGGYHGPDQVQLHNVIFGHIFPGQPAKCRHDNALADPQRHRRAHNPDPVDDLFGGC